MVARITRLRLLRGCCVGAFFLFLSTAIAATPHLSRSEAVRIANARVRKDMPKDYVREFRIHFARYFPEEHAWTVNYRSVKHSFRVFSVQVSDTTREATIWMP
ncbi:MAG: hypothetical protein QOH01_2893 [Verrucomicrobiota bacterium]|jgi:hypothetical protein